MLKEKFQTKMVLANFFEIWYNFGSPTNRVGDPVLLDSCER